MWAPMVAVLLRDGLRTSIGWPARRSCGRWRVSRKAILSNVKSVGEGVFECKIDFGPGYRVYFGRYGELLVILLTGGTKRRQQRDIERGRILAGLQAHEARDAMNGDG